MTDKRKIVVRLFLKVEVNIEAESDIKARDLMLERLEGMTITANDENWDCTLSDLVYVDEQ